MILLSKEVATIYLYKSKGQLWETQEVSSLTGLALSPRLMIDSKNRSNQDSRCSPHSLRSYLSVGFSQSICHDHGHLIKLDLSTPPLQNQTFSMPHFLSQTDICFTVADQSPLFV